MSNVDVMIFDMDLSNNSQRKVMDVESCLPSAPPPSPNSSSRRKILNIQFPISKLIDCCEDLVTDQKRNIFSNYRSRPLNMKRKTSDSDECGSSSSSSAGTSPGATSDCSCSFGKRSRSSNGCQSFSFKNTHISMMELSAAISSSET